MESFYSELAELLEVDDVKPDDVLENFETWDSLTVLALLASLDANYGVNLSAELVRQARTAADLASLVESRRNR